MINYNNLAIETLKKDPLKRTPEMKKDQVLAQEFRLTEGRAMPYEPQAEEHLSQGPIVFIKTSSVHNVFTGVRMSSGPSVHTCPLHRC